MSCRTSTAAAAALVALSFLSTPAAAVVVFDSGIELTDLDDGGVSDFDFESLDNDGAQQATLVTLPAAEDFNAIRWTGFYSPADTPLPLGLGGFTFQLFADAGGVPSTTPFAGGPIDSVVRTDSGLDFVFTGMIIGQRDIYEFTGRVPTTALPAGTSYLSIIANTTTDVDDTFSWLGQEQPAVTDWVRLLNPTEDWVQPLPPFSGRADVTLLRRDAPGGGGGAEVPLPAPLALLFAGVASLLGLGRLRSRAPG
ncbi:MAG: hypothetical protein AAF763_09875 [Pseudomonadota bacterium]